MEVARGEQGEGVVGQLVRAAPEMSSNNMSHASVDEEWTMDGVIRVEDDLGDCAPPTLPLPCERQTCVQLKFPIFRRRSDRGAEIGIVATQPVYGHEW